MDFKNLSTKLLKFIWKWLKKGIVLTFLGFMILGALFIPQVQTACLMILIIVACLVLAPLLGLAYFTYTARPTTTTAGTPASGKWWLIILDIIGYCFLLWLIKSEFPNFYGKWNTSHGDPNDSTFFWISNIALFLCIVAATVKFRRSWSFVGMIIIIFMILHHCWSDIEISNTNTNHKATETTVSRPIPGSQILMYSGYTPCDVYIGWKFEIRTEGNPITVKFQGVTNKIAYPGTGDFPAPRNMRSGYQHIESGDTANPCVPVKVYQVMK